MTIMTSHPKGLAVGNQTKVRSESVKYQIGDVVDLRDLQGTIVARIQCTAKVWEDPKYQNISPYVTPGRNPLSRVPKPYNSAEHIYEFTVIEIMT